MKPPRLLITTTLLLALPAQAVRTNELVGSFKIAADLSRRSSQELAVKQAATIITTYIASSVDTDGDPFPEPPPFRTGAGPAGGGLVPLNLGAPITDGYGANLGYCAWDNGSVTVSTNRLPGSTSDTGAVTFAVVSAGLDGVFNRTCAQIASGAVTTDDDFVASYNTAQIRQGVGGTVYFGDPVADMTALGALTSTRDGELRLVKSDNTLWRWNTTGSNWTSASNTYTANNVIITGGTINGTSIGNVTPSSGAFTTLAASAGITGNLTGNVTGNLVGNITGNVTGNADTATRLAVARTIGMTGDGNWSVAFDGSGNATGALVLASTGVSPGSYGSNVSVPTFTVDAKGRLTAAANIAITPSLSSLTGAAAANTIGNGAYTQNWNWQLTGNTSAFSIGETAASTGGSGTQYLMNIGTLAGSTAAPLRVSARGVEAFRVDSVNPQIVANAGALSAPSYSFNGNQGTGFYVPATGQLAASVGGTRAMWLPSTGTNAALGLTALTSNTTGVANTAIGYGTLAANTTGVDNTGIGETALAANTIGTWNTAVGQNALTANVSGNSNVAIGQASMISNVSGTDNVAVGSRSLQNSTAGYENTAVGNYTLYASAGVSGGFRNTALGINALRKNTSGAENTSTGAFTLTENTSGGSNVANGAYALQKNTTGSNNTALGAFAGNTVTRNISGSNSTFVGYRANIAETPEMVSASNITLLGANATASGLGSSNLDARMTAIGAGASVTSINTVVLGRAADSTVIGATADDLSGYKLQVTGGIQSKIASSGTGLNLIQTLGGFGSYLDIGASTYPGATNSNAATIRFIDAGFWTDHITFRTKNIGAMANTDAERMRLTYDGKLLIGSATDDGSGSLLQVTGGIKALTGGLSVAGGDLVLGSGTVSGLLSARPAFGVANRIYIGTDTNTIYRDTGSAWVALGSAGAASLSSLTAATAANTIANGVNAQNWNWQLTGNTSAFSIGETAASTGGSGTQYLMNIGTLAASTAIPLSVSVRGVEAFRVDSVNPQLVANIGTVAAPGYAFAGQQSTGFYLPAAGELAASVNGVRSMRLTTGNTSFGSGALAVDSTPGNNNNAFGAGALAANTTGSQNQAFGNNALRVNTSGSKNIAVGGGSLLSNISGSSNVAIGDAALFFNTAGDNVAIGDSTLFSNLGGMNNAALGSAALYANTSGNNNTALGENAGYRDATFSIANANTTGSNNTFIGANAMSGSATQLNYATALGSGSLVSSANTIVLGRAADATVIGATADDLSGYKLQVTGGINALTGGLSVAGGDLVLGSGTVSGLLSARPAFGVANRIYIGTDTNTIYRDNGSAWVALGSAGAASLSSLTAATAANTIANGVNAQNWNWQLTGNTSAFSIGETAASTGGSGTQYLMNIGTLAASTAIPLSVSVRGVEAFRVDSVNPQLVANNGTVAAPGYAFAGQQSTGFYLQGTDQLAASVGGTRSLWLTSGSVGLGFGTLASTASTNSTAVGYRALYSNTSGDQNVALGWTAMESNQGGNYNASIGTKSMRSNIGGSANTALGNSALEFNINGSYNVAIGTDALSKTTTSFNTAIGASAMKENLTGIANSALGSAALASNTTGSDNTAIGNNALLGNIGGDSNTAVGGYALRTATGSQNTALGRYAGYTLTNPITAGASTFLGYNATLADNATTAGSGAITLLGANTSASLGTATPTAFMTAIGSGASVTSINTVVLGRAADSTVIGATADDLSGFKLQVTGGIKALTGGLSLAGGDLVLGSGTVSGLLSDRPLVGTANRIYIGTDTNTIYRDTGSAWVALGSAGAASLSSLTAATAANTIANGVNAQNWNWQLAGNTSAFSIGETAASTGGSGTQYLMNIGTLAASTAIPLSVSVRGVEAFRVDSVNPQLVANNGTVAAPGYAFAGQQSTGFYLPATGQLGASVAGSRSLWLTAGSASLGQGALLNDTSVNATAVGTNAMTANTSGIENSAFGFNALTSNTTGVKNTAAGFESLKFNTTGNENAAFGRQALLNNTMGNSNVGAGPNALLFNTIGNNNIAVGGGSLFSNVSGSSNVAVGNAALFFNAASDNIAMGDGTLFSNNSGAENVALGGNALRANTTGNGNVAVGRFAGFQDAGNGTTNANVGGNYNTFLGNRAMTGTTATINYATALGAAALVSSSNTVVLGRTSDVTVIGATADDVSGYKLQVTGGIKALTGGLSVAGGDLVLGSGTVSGLLSARPAFGVANRIYVSTDTNEIYRDTGGAWNRIAAGAAGGILASADFANQGTTTTVLHGNAAGNPSWSAVNLTSDVSGVLPITAGGTGTSTVPAANSVLMMNGSGSYVPTTFGFTNGTVSISTTGTSGSITFINPQQLGSANSPSFTNLTLSGALRTASGTAAAPSHTFSADLTTGLYRPAAGQLGASVSGTRSMWITAGSVGLGSGALASDSAPATNFNVAVGLNALNATTTGVNNTGVGYRTLALNVSGADNAAFGANALRLSTGSSNTGLGSGTLYSNTTGSWNTAVGRDALNQNVGGTYNTALGNESMYNNTSGTYNVATGYTALRNNSTGSYNVASGYQAGFTTTNAITGSNSTFIGTSATIGDTAQMASASNITLLGAGTTASGITGANGQDVRMTAIGAGASVTSINTVVLGRAADSTVIGATADDLSGYKLQATGGIQSKIASSGTGLYLINTLAGAGSYVDIAASTYGSVGLGYPTNGNPATIRFIDTNYTNHIAFRTKNAGAAANPDAERMRLTADGKLLIGSATDDGSGSLLQVAGGVTTTGRITSSADYRSGGTAAIGVQGAYLQWNRQNGLGKTYLINQRGAGGGGISFGESTAADVYTENMSLSAAGALNVAGAVTAPSYAFAADATTKLYVPVVGQLAADISGTRGLWITASSTAIGKGALASGSSSPTSYNVAVGVAALNSNTAGSENTAIGSYALYNNTGVTGGYRNSASGMSALNQNTTGYENTASGAYALEKNTIGNLNVASGAYALLRNTTGSSNTALGASAGYTATNPVTGSNSTFIGAAASVADTAQMVSASNVTLLGAGATASGITGANNQDVHMTAIGAGASVTSINTVVLGRAADSTVIGATADDLSGYKLQVTGGIKALTGGISVAGGDLVLGSGTVSGLLSARPAFGTANRIYIGTDTNTIYRDTGSAWVALGSAGATSLSSLTAATAANTIDNAAYDQNWKWQLTGAASTGFSIGETAASTAGAGAQYLAKIGTLATSTAIPLSVSSQGTEAFRVNSTTPQILAAVGSATAPTYSFAGNSTTGFYSSSSALAASYGGVRSLLINSNTGLGQNALRDITTGGTNVSVGGLYKLTDGSSNTAVGNGALANSLSGGQNVAVGSLAGYTSSDYSGSSSIFIGASAIPNTTRLSTAGRITLIGSDTSASLSSNPSATNVYMTALGSLASVTSENTIVLGRAGSDSIVIGATGVATSGNALSKTLQVTGTVGVTGSVTALSYVTSSDLRLKENISRLDRTDTVQRFKSLNGYRYNLIADPKKTPTYGVIAQEIVTLFPDAVRTREDGFYAVDYGALSALTASAVGQLATNMDKYGLPSNGNTAANGALLIGNGKGYTSSTLTAGAGIGIVNDAGNITINNTGVTGFNGRTGNVILGLDDVNGVTSFGNGNVTLGKGALAATATGAFNTASGQGALASTNNGSGNSAQGYQALFGNTSGTNNTGLGRQAGYANRAGSSANANLGGSNNTFIGANTLPGTAQQLNYATAIGSDAIVTTSGTIVLGRNNDVTVLGAAGDDRSGNRLQVTGGIKATGNLTAQALSLSTGTNTKAGLWIENGAAAGAGNGLVQTDDSTLLFSKGQIDGAAALVIAPWANGSSGLRIAASGVSVAGSLAVNGTVSGTSAFAVSSDIRYKKNITPVINALATIEALQGVHYEFDRAAFPKKGFEAGRQLGFIAQQIEQFVPEVVRTDTEGYKSVQYSQLVPLLAEGIKAQQLILKHLTLKDPATLLVDIKTFQGNDAVFENIKATNIKTANLEADTARIKKLEADRIETKFLRSDVMKTGETEVFVSLGSFQPIFVPLADAQYIVNATADDGSSAFASVAFMAGKITVTPISGKGVDVTTMGSQVGLVAASKKIKATWIRMS